MKVNLRNLIGAGLIVLLMAIAPVAAHATEGSSGSSSGSSSNESTETETETTEPSTEPSTDSAAMKVRLDKLKDTLKLKLAASEQEHLKGRCKAAQTVVGTVGDSVKSKFPVREKAYIQIVTNLNKLVVKLKAKNADTTALEAQIAVLQTKIDQFNTDVAAYRQSLTDLKTIDCTTDPTTFKTALVASRTAHDKVLADAADIKTYVKGTIKVTLEGIRSSLETAEKASNSTTN